MKIILTALAALAFALPLSAQTCQLDDPPALRGFKLGQRYEESSERFSNPKVSDHDGGIREVIIEAMPKEAEYKGVSSIKLTYLDGLLAQVRISYDRRDVMWDSNEQFAEAAAKSMALPSRGWKVDTDNRRGDYELKCKNFRVGVNKLYNDVAVGKPNLIEELSLRLIQAGQKKRGGGKP